MSDIQTIKADHLFTHVTGSVRVSVNNQPVHTFERLDTNPAGAIYKAILNFWTDIASPDHRVVLQYSPGPEGNEAGSRWFDVHDAPHDGTYDTLSEFFADSVLGYIAELDAAFTAGKTFVQ